jgi:ParB-like chromosome segregation protein Spo0J
MSGYIVAGHARLEAAKVLNLAAVPVDAQPFASEADELAYLLADNRIAELADLQTAALKDLLEELDTGGFDMDLTGFVESERERLATQVHQDDDTYTNKIVAPVYEPKGDTPPIASLIDREKTDRLQTEIEAANVPADVARFLKDAAERHTVFHFGRIAEWYCHATPQVQDLMERSGLVIIDFHKAIEYGFVHLTERLGALADLEEGGEDA